MFHGIYKLTNNTVKKGLDVDTACALDMIELVKEFDSYGDVLDALAGGVLSGEYDDTYLRTDILIRSYNCQGIRVPSVTSLSGSADISQSVSKSGALFLIMQLLVFDVV